jgi:hypothetical protein
MFLSGRVVCLIMVCFLPIGPVFRGQDCVTPEDGQIGCPETSVTTNYAA